MQPLSVIACNREPCKKKAGHEATWVRRQLPNPNPVVPAYINWINYKAEDMKNNNDPRDIGTIRRRLHVWIASDRLGGVRG